MKQPNIARVLKTNILGMIDTYLPEERKAVAERRAELEAELAALTEYDATLERIEIAIGAPSCRQFLSIERTGS